MPAARYWKLAGMRAHGGGDVEISEVGFYDASAAELAAPASLTFTLTPVSGTTANLLDGNLSTTLRFNPSPANSALIADFGASTAPTVAGIRVGSGALKATFLAQVDLFSSNDGVNWTREARYGDLIWPGANTFTSPPATADANYEDVVLLLHFNGDNNSTVITDSSKLGNAVVANGGAKLTTSQSKFGGAAAVLNGSDAYFSGPTSTTFTFGVGDFCIEGWVYVTAYPTSEAIFVCLRNASLDIFNNMVRLSSAGKIGWSDGFAWRESANAIPLSQWVHIAVCRSGGTLRIFINGVQNYSASHPIDLSGVRVMQVGAFEAYASNPVGGFFTGYIDDLRITKGVARYTSDFTPPASSFTDSVTGVPTEPQVVRARSAGAPNEFFREDIFGAVGAVEGKAPLTLRDMYQAGRGAITGTVKEKHDPENTPVYRRVRLIQERSGNVVAETWSDPTTGAYTFTEIDENQVYTVLSYDHLGNFRAVAADKLTPTVL